MGAEIIKACVFCGEFRPMTKEHIWGDWIRSYVPGGPKRHFMRDVEMVSRNVPESVSIIRRSGNALENFEKIVCADCNTRFMSRLQNNAKPYLIPLLEGQKTVIGRDAQTAIAAWATMVTMTAEFMLAGTKLGVLQTDRTALQTAEKPLNHWKIWIGHYPGNGEWPHQWSHTSVPVIGGEQLPSAEKVYTPLPNTQTTTFVIGKLYVHAMSCEYPEIVRDWHWLWNTRLRNLLIQIWPMNHQFLAWPIHGLIDADVKLSSEMFIRHIDGIAKRAGL